MREAIEANMEDDELAGSDAFTMVDRDKGRWFCVRAVDMRFGAPGAVSSNQMCWSGAPMDNAASASKLDASVA